MKARPGPAESNAGPGRLAAMLAISGAGIVSLLLWRSAASGSWLDEYWQLYVSLAPADGTLARRLLADVHADLHRLPHAGWPLQEGDEPIALRKIANIRERIARYRFADLEDGLAWLERHAPAVLPEAAVVTHNDFHPLNVMVTPKGRLSVIDWSEAALGDRHHDIARTLTLFSFAYIGASSSIERVLLKAAAATCALATSTCTSGRSPSTGAASPTSRRCNRYSRLFNSGK